MVWHWVPSTMPETPVSIRSKAWPTLSPDIRKPTSSMGLPTPVIHDLQDSKRPPIRQAIMHEIHAPALRRTGRDRGWATMQRDIPL